MLIIAAAGHDILAKLMYAWMLPARGGPAAERKAWAELMYYCGTAIDVALAVIVMTQWYLATGRALARGPAAGSGARRDVHRHGPGT